MLLLGKTGKGKTAAAVALVRRLCSEGAQSGGQRFYLANRIMWQSCRELSEMAREYTLGKGIPEYVTNCQYAGLLILNDLGAKDHVLTLERVLDYRYEKGLPVIVTSGMNSQALKDNFDEALLRRLTECKGKPAVVVEEF